MKKTLKKSISIFLAVICVLSLISFAFSANAADNNDENEAVGEVRVVVQNLTYPEADGAAWDGVLIDFSWDIYENSTMQSVVEDLLNAAGYDYTFNSWNYLATINELSEYDCNGSGGWMMTLNDWFTTQSAVEYTVANGGLQDGDEIFVMYTTSWGADIGSLWGNSDTTLNYLGVTNGTLDKGFDATDNSYDLYVMKDDNSVKITPEAVNKNYQVRTYKNEYTPETDGTEIKRSKSFEVSEGDVIYVGVGNPAWPTMNEAATETVYTLNVKYAPELGDFDGDDERTVNDATMMLKYLIRLESFNNVQEFIANVNGDKYIDVLDATAIQKIAAGIPIA